ncbi:MAG TPA: hypothetical protein VK890_03435 [Bacteroidia bacterium]|jgi:hypothetical protein|nr:hypothetical protein [Bacteroidia bacterium]
MIIETKYDIGQEVWVRLKCGNIWKIDSRQIHGILRMISGKTIYMLEKYRGLFETEFQEQEIFANEADLKKAHPDLKLRTS